jgi:hypothetical protein
MAYRARRPYKPCRSRGLEQTGHFLFDPTATPHRRPPLRPGRDCRGLRDFARSHLAGPFDLDLPAGCLTGVDASRVDGRLSEPLPSKT